MLYNLAGFTLLALIVLAASRVTVGPSWDALAVLFGRRLWLLFLAPLYAAMLGVPSFIFGYAVRDLSLALQLGAVGALLGVLFVVGIAVIYPEED